MRIRSKIKFKDVSVFTNYSEYLSKYKNKEFVSFDDAVSDLSLLTYLLATSYSGYEEMLQKGFEPKTFSESVVRNFSGSGIKIEDFLNLIFKELEQYIEDSHFAFFFDDGNRELFKTFAKHKDLYMSDIQLRKKGCKFIVLKDEFNVLADINEITSVPQENLFRIVSVDVQEEEQLFRIGVLSFSDIKSFLIKIDNRFYEIPVTKNLSSETTDKSIVVQASKKTVYIRIPTFSIPPAESKDYSEKITQFKNLIQNHNIYIDKENIIADLRGNSGGSTIFAFPFLYTLYLCSNKKSKLFFLDFIVSQMTTNGTYELESAAIVQGHKAYNEIYYPDSFLSSKLMKLKCKMQKIHPTKKICMLRSFFRGKKIPFMSAPKYKGNLIVVQDKNVASSAEAFIQVAKKLFGRTGRLYFIGENTRGTVSQGNIIEYILPYSGIVVKLGSKNLSKSFMEKDGFMGENTGYAPDFWSTDTEINDLIKKYVE